LIQSTAAAQQAVREAWVEVRDGESGDVWFFNQRSGESQWEMPEALIDLLPAGDRVKKLPPLVVASPRRERGQPDMHRSSSLAAFPTVTPLTHQSNARDQRPRSAGSFLPDITKGHRACLMQWLAVCFSVLLRCPRLWEPARVVSRRSDGLRRRGGLERGWRLPLRWGQQPTLSRRWLEAHGLARHGARHAEAVAVRLGGHAAHGPAERQRC
jgi:hypothetical protein